MTTGILAAAKHSPVVRAMAEAARVTVPFGPGDYPEPFTVDAADRPDTWAGSYMILASCMHDLNRYPPQ
jgi:hypothetical protein